jgi:hypothetical protein
MKLTKEQIQQLYKFTRQHYVEHYDVQTELVDHLANDIEQIWTEQPHLSFEQARTISFKKFGVFGFMDVVEKKQKLMNKRYWNILWRFVKEWFTLPKIILTTLIFLLFFSIFQFTYATEIIFVSLLILVIFDFYYLFKNRAKRKRNKMKKEKIFLLESMIGQTRNGFSIMTFVNVFNIINITDLNFNSLSFFWLVFIAAFVTLICIVFYITGFVMPQKAKELMKETYPEYTLLAI